MENKESRIETTTPALGFPILPSILDLTTAPIYRTRFILKIPRSKLDRYEATYSSASTRASYS
jgi:hypothetical protein